MEDVNVMQDGLDHTATKEFATHDVYTEFVTTVFANATLDGLVLPVMKRCAIHHACVVRV